MEKVRIDEVANSVQPAAVMRPLTEPLGATDLTITYDELEPELHNRPAGPASEVLSDRSRHVATHRHAPTPRRVPMCIGTKPIVVCYHSPEAMYTHNGEDMFVIDGHVHLWDATEENIIHEGGEQFIQCFYDYHAAFTPEEEQWDMDTYRKYGKERMIQDLFRDGHVDMGIFQPTYLTDFYDEGFNTTDQNAELAEEYPERFVLNGSFDPRDGDEGIEHLERLKDDYDIQGVKLYTAEWRGDSKGWRLDSEESFRFLEKCAELGIENIHAHKGPTIRPLNRDAFDVGDVDDAASSFPELNFVVEHIGFPRVDDFCHIATQETNVYGGLAVAAPFAQNRPRKFAEMMGELLFWVGEDNLLFGSDYGIWEPDWLVPAVMEAELTQEERAEYGVELSPEVKRKIMGENAARLYDIDVEAKKEQFRNDEISQQFDLGSQYEGAAAD